MAAGSRSFTNTCNGNHGSHYTQTLIVNWGDYDIANNRTYVSISYQRTRDSGYNNYGYANPSQISIDGSQVANATPYSAHNQYATQTLCTWEGWIYHNNEGQKSINVSASFSSTSSNLSGGNVSGIVDLPTIPRASSINASSVDIGSNTTISINRASNSFTHTITYSFGSLSGTIATKTSNTSISWQVPTSFYEQIPNAKSGTCTLTCKTFNGDKEIGTSTTTFKATANEELCRPDLNVAVEDINDVTIALTGESSKLVRYRSTARISTSSTAKKNATISKTTINGVEGGIRTITNVETNEFEVIVTDSRGYSKKVIITVPIVNYIPLSASSTFKRVSNTSDKVNLSYSGNYFDDSFGAVENLIALQYKYRLKGSDKWINGEALYPTIENNKFNDSLELTEDFDYRKNWEFSLFYLDSLTSGNTGINNVLKGNGELEIYPTAIKIFGANLFDLIYPVGSIYISTTSTNPNSLFGVGTWEAFATGRTLIGIDANQTEFNTIEKTGGEKNHTLSISEMPSHNHSARLNNNGGHVHNMKFGSGANSGDGSIIPIASNYYGMDNGSMTDGSHDHGGITVDNNGGGTAHNNMPPYITVYMWKRVS
jgi:hypothetical protein